MKIINPVELQLLTPGERYVLEQKLKKLLGNEICYIYIQPNINNQRPDFIVIGKTFGVLIIEVKDWDDEFILSVNRNIVNCSTGRFKNPISQINAYHNIVYNKLNGVVDFLDVNGELNVPIRSIIFYVNLSENALTLHPDLTSNEVVIFSRRILRTLTLEELLDSSQIQLSPASLLTIRGLLFPEIMIPNEEMNLEEEMIEVGDIRALDSEQEELAKKVPNGHYMVSGIPGSGKTVILLSRALHLVQNFENYQVLILTYTKALANKLRHQLNLKAQEMHVSSPLLDRIEIRHFHQLCHDLVGYDQAAQKKYGNEYFSTIWPKEVIQAMKNKSAIYDAVLIDEFQDFHVDWFEVCKIVCRKNQDGQENLFFAGDRLQRIYNIPWNSYKEIGINIVGRSKLLKTPYRTNQNHFDFALKFLAQNEVLAKDIGNFYEIERLNTSGCQQGLIDMVHGDVSRVIEYIQTLLAEPDVLPEDILLLCHTNHECREMLNAMPTILQQHFVSGKEMEKQKGLITTYHSSKGLESKYCVLYQVEKFEPEKEKRILLYVGMTRASQKLAIHYQRDKNFATEILQLM